MFWFFRRKREERPPLPDTRRFLLARASLPAVIDRLAAHDDLAPSGQPHPVRMRDEGGWVRIDLPDGIHPWMFHQLALWLFDLPGAGRGDVVAVSAPHGAAPGYALTDDPENDWLSGPQEDGAPITVAHPAPWVVRGEGAPDTPPSPRALLDALSVPSALRERRPGGQEIALRIEDPGDDLNPHLQTTDATREAMRARARVHQRF